MTAVSEAPAASVEAQTESDKPVEKKAEPVVCKCSPSLPKLLHNAGLTVMLTTYQTGHVILARAESEQKLNTLFRRHQSPMGVAIGRRNLAIGTKQHVWTYRNNGSLRDKLQPPGKHDLVFVPSNTKHTGDIRIHEMVYQDDELWAVNTRFSCLVTIDADHSFVPRWRPPFITEMAAEDRCHLNGIAMRDGKIAYVSMLAMTNTPQGWREHKRDGGVIMEYPSGKVVVSGLSMPHSPRWYQDQLWVLESGKGGLCKIGPGGEIITVAQLPGFTRGLAFAGPFAFIGLSKVRETNIFGGIELNERVKEKQCGMVVVDIRTGKLVASMRFESGVTEIFDVQLLRAKWPELMEPHAELLGSSFIVPNDSLKDMKATVDVRTLKSVERQDVSKNNPEGLKELDEREAKAREKAQKAKEQAKAQPGSSRKA